MLTEEGAHLIHERVLTHGPGFIYCSTREEALQSLQASNKKLKPKKVNFTITEDAMVSEAVQNIVTENISNQIQELENYGTRYHTSNSARQSAEDLKAKWENMAALYGRTDVTVRLVEHQTTSMPSVVMTIEGAEFPDQYVVVGGHLDSTSNRNSSNDAPGADDDASGIATITEAARAIFEAGFVPMRTIEVMAYAAEEVGLRGSNEIASSYKQDNKDVLAVAQFDMTNYNGSAKDIYFIDDNTDESLNTFMMSLIDYYNNLGIHQLTYGTATCNYGCSDHDSWDNQGYPATFPFEARFSQYNPYIHTTGDTFDLVGTAEHATKFARLCVEFLIEVAKSSSTVLAINEFSKEQLNVFVKNDKITYSLPEVGSGLKMIQVYDSNGRNVFQKLNPDNQDTFSLNELSSGVYIVSFQLENEQQLTKKIILE